MAITRFRNSSILNRGPKYNDFLAGLPFRPIIGTATDGGTGTTVSVAFTGNNPAGAGITYTALSSPGNFTATGPASPITVSGLTSGTAYTFQVKAGNSLGDSAYSSASNSVTPVTPTAFESIASSSPNGVATFDFTSIPGTYQHLQIRFSALTATNGQALKMRLNGITTSSYSTHYLLGHGSGTSASGGANQTSIDIGGQWNGTYTDKPMVGIIDLHDYASTTKNKTVRTFSGEDGNGAGESELVSGAFLSTSAITSITIFTSGTNFSSGTTFALYGIKGA